MTEFRDLLGDVYNAFDESLAAHAYAERHGIAAQAVLTVTDDEIADLIASERSDPPPR